jgi:hypothetical protein
MYLFLFGFVFLNNKIIKSSIKSNKVCKNYVFVLLKDFKRKYKFKSPSRSIINIFNLSLCFDENDMYALSYPLYRSFQQYISFSFIFTVCFIGAARAYTSRWKSSFRDIDRNIYW